ncbi:MAG: hypothetical protein IT460_08115 [Planctomycetes bacterium]|nr:hypothetical protein [Planctomycetota bacterium]
MVLPRLDLGTPRRAALAAALAIAVVLGAVAGPAVADPPTVEAAEAALAHGDAPAALAAFRALAATPEGAEDPRVLAGLGAALVRTGDPRAALDPVGGAVRRRGNAGDRALYAEALLAVAKENAARGPRSGLDVMPYLRDAVTQGEAAKDATAAEAARLARAVGEARWMLGDAKGARDALAHPGLVGDAEAQDLLARACFGVGDFAQAATAWERAGSRRGVAAARAAGRDERAVADFAALVLESPTDLALVDDAIGAAVWVGKPEALDTALAAAPGAATSPAVLRARGRLAERAGRLDDAVARYREARAAAPDDVELVADLARARLRAAPEDAAAVEEATAWFLEVLARNPADSWARQGLEYVARRDTDAAPKAWPDTLRLTRAVRIFGALAQADPADAVAWANLGTALRNAGDAKGAVEALDRAVEANPYDGSLQNDRGIALLARGDRAAARAAFDRAAALDPTATAPHQNAARLARLDGDVAGARAHLAAAITVSRSVGGHPMLYRAMLDRVWREAGPAAGR